MDGSKFSALGWVLGLVAYINAIIARTQMTATSAQTRAYSYREPPAILWKKSANAGSSKSYKYMVALHGYAAHRSGFSVRFYNSGADV